MYTWNRPIRVFWEYRFFFKFCIIKQKKYIMLLILNMIDKWILAHVHMLFWFHFCFVNDCIKSQRNWKVLHQKVTEELSFWSLIIMALIPQECTRIIKMLELGTNQRRTAQTIAVPLSSVQCVRRRFEGLPPTRGWYWPIAPNLHKTILEIIKNVLTLCCCKLCLAWG